MNSKIKINRKFLSKDLIISTWESVQPYYEQLISHQPANQNDFLQWFGRSNELEAALQEHYAWLYIRMTCNTLDKEIATTYSNFVQHVKPKVIEYQQQLTQKYYHSPFRNELNPDTFKLINWVASVEIELYRADNVPILSEIDLETQQYDALIGAMTIEVDNQTLTLPQAALQLEITDRNKRETVWKKLSARRLHDKDVLDTLFNKLINLRQQVAKNANYQSFTDYQFKNLARIDFTKKDCLDFQTAIEKVVKPLYIQLMNHRKKALNLSQLRPWDTAVDLYGTEPLRPFKDDKELITKALQLFHSIRPELATMVKQLQDLQQLDLASHIGKAPGGYNYPLYETGVPFIFMNAAGAHQDLITLIHECGHAIHSIVTADLQYNTHKSPPSEVAELASMSMEYIAQDYLQIFYPSPKDQQRALYQQLSRTIILLPWIALVDAFQQWIYDNPTHSISQRCQQWTTLYYRFHGDAVDWSGFETELSYLWQKQQHIFDVPFYYIEYGIAQLGALQVWQNFQQNPQLAIDNYLKALKLGYTQTPSQIYKTAGITFSLSEQTIQHLFSFLNEKISGLQVG